MSKSPMLPSIKSLLNMPSDMDAHPHHSHHSRKPHHSSSTSSSRSHHHYNPDRRPKPYDSHRQPEIPKLPSVNEVLASAQNSSHDSFLPYNNYKKDSASSSRDIRNTAETSKKSGYPCERCGRLFTRKSDALKHIRVVHDRLKVYACCVCDRRFARKDYCTKHEKSLHNIVAPPTPYQLRRKLAKERAENAYATQR